MTRSVTDRGHVCGRSCCDTCLSAGVSCSVTFGITGWCRGIQMAAEQLIQWKGKCRSSSSRTRPDVHNFAMLPWHGSEAGVQNDVYTIRGVMEASWTWRLEQCLAEVGIPAKKGRAQLLTFISSCSCETTDGFLKLR